MQSLLMHLLPLALVVSSLYKASYEAFYSNIEYQFEQEPPRQFESIESVRLKRHTWRKVEGKIVRGQNAIPNSWPYLVRLLIRVQDKQKSGVEMTSICGGSLLSNREVLTAAHCFMEPSTTVTAIVAVIGGHDITEGFSINASTKVISHPQYKADTFFNDIAIVRLQRAVPAQLAYLVRLPSSPQLPEMIWHECVTMGWGQLDQKKAETSEYLQVATLPLIADPVCERAYKKADFNRAVMLCAGFLDGSRDACRGDSGGPYLCPTPDGTWYQIGIVSFGIGCARKGIPGYYTRITTFLSWIEANRLPYNTR